MLSPWIKVSFSAVESAGDQSDVNTVSQLVRHHPQISTEFCFLFLFFVLVGSSDWEQPDTDAHLLIFQLCEMRENK